MILDTDFLIDLMNGKKEAVEKLDEFLDSEEPVAVSAITVMQLFHGVGKSNRPQQEENKIHSVLHGLVTYPIDFELARRAGKKEGELAKNNIAIGYADTIIATTALSLNEPIVTRNVKDFSKVHGLEIISY